MITSKDNAKIKYARKLYNAKYRKENKQFIVEGSNLVEMAYNAKCIDYVITTDETIEGLLVSEAVMKSLVKTVNPPSVCAVCNFPQLTFKQNRVLVLDDIQDPGNLGTLLRSALAFNFDAVVCSNNTVDIYNDKVVRSSLGAMFFIPVIYTDLCEYLQNSDNPTIGTFIDGDNKLPKHDNYNLVIGNEGHGISAEVAKFCEIRYRININENIESLNAAVAGSILMFELGGK